MIGRVGLVMLVVGLCGCPQGQPAPAGGSGHGSHAPRITNRIATPETVRRNLGITFVKAEYRKVGATRRYPGTFEYRPSAVHRYPAPVGGRVELPTEKGALRQYRPVARGQLLYRLHAPGWSAMQRDLARAESAISGAARALAGARAALVIARGRLAILSEAEKAAEEHLELLKQQLALHMTRIERLEKLAKTTGGQALELETARIEAGKTRLEISEAREKHVEAEQTQLALRSQVGTDAAPGPLVAAIAEREAEQRAAQVQLASLRRTAAAWHGLTVEELESRWRTLSAIEVRARADGVVLSLAQAHGSWVEAHTDVLATVDPGGLRFVAHAPQGELAALKDGLPARVVPPEGGGVPIDAAIDGALRLMPQADAHERTLPLVLELTEASQSWARAGVAAYLEVTLAGGQREELAIPRRAVIRDGLKDVFFRRDPKDPDKVIRVEADLGVSDGRWIEVKSGLAEGNEVVVTGVYPLMLASASQTSTKAGHFHADGTWHEGDH